MFSDVSQKFKTVVCTLDWLQEITLKLSRFLVKLFKKISRIFWSQSTQHLSHTLHHIFFSYASVDQKFVNLCVFKTIQDSRVSWTLRPRQKLDCMFCHLTLHLPEDHLDQILDVNVLFAQYNWISISDKPRILYWVSATVYFTKISKLHTN